MFSVWLKFFISAGIIIAAGTKLSFYANIISERTGLSKAWVGMVLLGLVTSLPELATTFASAVKLNAPDLALGNVLGSNIFNLMIIVLLNFMHRQGSITGIANHNRSHIRSAVLTLIFSAIVILSILLSSRIGISSIGNVGLGSIMIAIIYIVGMRSISKFETRGLPVQPEGKGKGLSLSGAYAGFIVAGALVVASGVWLASIGDGIARATGWERTFVGSILLAIVTSFPEIVVSVTALKLGSIDMAFGNIFGSNMINLFIIPITDAAYQKGAILSFVSQTHILTASMGIVLTCIAIIGLSRRLKKTFLGLGWDAIVMVLVYLSGTYMLFRLR